MGLDAVEIVMAVEDAFDIQIENSEAEKLLTPGQLIDFVMGKVATTRTDVCLTHRSFNLLRSFFVRRCGLQRKQLTPETSLRLTMPAVNRQQCLGQLSAELAITSLPELVRPDWLKTLLWVLALLAGFAAAISLGRLNSALWIPGMLAAMIAAGYIGATATKSRCTEFPKDVRTVGDLAKWVLTHKPDLATPEKTSWTREQVACRVREIVINTLGCESIYREDARFVQELGLD
jgi:acyl carrier protein